MVYSVNYGFKVLRPSLSAVWIGPPPSSVCTKLAERRRDERAERLGMHKSAALFGLKVAAVIFCIQFPLLLALSMVSR